MKFARVIGNVVATHKDKGISHRKLMLLQPVDEQFQPAGSYLVAVDSVGVGAGELVLFTSGSSSRLTSLTRDTPCDCVIVAVVDQVEMNGKLVFNKAGEI